MDPERLCAIFKAISDENRLRIVCMLSDRELCACKLIEELGVSQPNLSHHMGILQRSGLVNGRKEGQWVHYSLNHDTLMEMDGFIESLIDRNKGCECCRTE